VLTENITLRDGFQVWEGDSTLNGSSPTADFLVLVGELRESTDTLAEECERYPAPVTMLAATGLIALADGITEIVRESMPLTTHTHTANQLRDPRFGWKRSDFDPGIAGDVAAITVARHCDEWREAIETEVAEQMLSDENDLWITKDEATERKNIFAPGYGKRPKLAYTASLAVAESKHWHGDLVPGATCTCEHDPAARALYLNGEYGVPLYNEHEWDILNQAFEHSSKLNRKVRDGWMKGDGPMQRALRAHTLLALQRDDAEARCPSDRHYFGLELEQMLAGSPEIAAPAAKTTASHPPNKYGISFPRVEARKFIWDYDAEGHVAESDLVVIPRFVKTTTESNEAALDEIAAHENYEFAKGRSPVIAGMAWDEARGYEVNPAHRVNDTSFGYFVQQIEAEYARRESRGDVYLSPKRGTRHTWKFQSSRGVYVNRRTKGWSPFYAQKQTERRLATQRKRRLIAQMVETIGRDVHDPKIIARIQELGYDGAFEALSALINRNREIDCPAAKTKVIV
jgi:hypothetical protein